MSEISVDEADSRASSSIHSRSLSHSISPFARHCRRREDRQTRTGGTRRSRRPLCPAGRRTLADGEDARVVLVDHSPHQVAACSSDGSPAAVCLSCEGGGGLSPDVSAAGGSAFAAVDGCHRVAGLNSSAHHQLVSSATCPSTWRRQPAKGCRRRRRRPSYGACVCVHVAAAADASPQ